MKFVSASTALCYDPEHRQMVIHTISVGADGRRYERLNDGPDVPLDDPAPAKRNRQRGRRSTRK